MRQTLFDKYGEGEVYAGGMQVTTTLDLGLQAEAEDAIKTALPDQRNDPAAALVAMDPRTGQILAMAGGRDWNKSQFNYATGSEGGSGRQSGSAFKAFTLAAAMQQGYDPNAYWNGPSTIGIPQCPDPSQPDGIWHPVNAGDGEAGTFTLFGATAHSVNTIFAQVIAQLGPEHGRRHGPRARDPVRTPRRVLDHARVGSRQPARDDQRVRDARRSGRAALTRRRSSR